MIPEVRGYMVGIDNIADARRFYKATEEAFLVRIGDDAPPALVGLWDTELQIAFGILAMYQNREAMGDIITQFDLMEIVIVSVAASSNQSGPFQLGVALAAENILIKEGASDGS